ncbi:MAG: hypothetical protein CMB80_24880 [Flammeovirgaceae bacterium]|nr:hypothetical protein [Flammeovirgaceae bacterium]MBE63159.1 hypothetical protein [Flammeovirgaceae bacterium]MBR08719.1 hypothetical protein [Rickettsiales bacterium]HCX23310.1 hypothetical protein [Cytophagales bacterium]|tara:strand:+ start:352 stop:660 length:309 start_codon:yes stop_codon:yes gene_type:complete
MKMYQLVWHYECSPDQKDQFEEAYRRNGTWFHFYEKSDDYLGQELIKKVDKNDYLVIDSWVCKDSYESFLSINKAEYDQLNEQCKSLYSKEEFLGFYETVDH